ncbi:hypothetical protein AB0G02_33455 [Actinosynnema sp. NPDC023658]
MAAAIPAGDTAALVTSATTVPRPAPCVSSSSAIPIHAATIGFTTV